MYASNNGGSEALSFVAQLLEWDIGGVNSELKNILRDYPQLADHLVSDHHPAIVRFDGAFADELLTEAGEPPEELIERLNDMKNAGWIDGMGQLGIFEVRKAISADRLSFFRVLDLEGYPPKYRLEGLS